MTRLRLADVQVGMELAEEVKNNLGMVLFQPGTRVDERHLKAFKAWGVTEIAVKETVISVEQASGEQDEEGEVLQEKLEDRLRRLLKKNDLTQPVMKELFRIVLTRKRNGKE